MQPALLPAGPLPPAQIIKTRRAFVQLSASTRQRNFPQKISAIQPPFVDFQQSELEVVLVQCFTIIIIVIIFAEKHSKI